MRIFHWRSGLSFLVTLLLVAGCGFLGLLAAVGVVQAFHNGFLARWSPLGTPPGGAVLVHSVKFSSVSERTVVETTDGKYYEYRPGLSPKWLETTWPYATRTEPFATCPGYDRPRPSLPGTMVDCIGHFTWEWQMTEDYVAVLQDGSVWKWHYGISLMQSLLLLAVAIILGATGGFFLSRPARKLMNRYLH